METYKKPVIVRDDESAQNAFPAAAIAAAAVAGFSLALAKGKLKIDSTHTQALTTRKNFSFA